MTTPDQSAASEHDWRVDVTMPDDETQTLADVLAVMRENHLQRQAAFLIEHEEVGDECVCGPDVEFVEGGGKVVTHHSLDGREEHEIDA